MEESKKVKWIYSTHPFLLKWFRSRSISPYYCGVFLFFFLHLHKIVEWLYFHFSLSVCVCVCVCVSGISCEQNSSRTDTPILIRFSLNGCFPHWLKLYWILWPWVKGHGHSDVIVIFSYDSLLISLPCILVSQLSYVWSKWNSVYNLDKPVVDLCLICIKFKWKMTSLWRHSNFLQTIVHISNSIEHTQFILGTNTQFLIEYTINVCSSANAKRKCR